MVIYKINKEIAWYDDIVVRTRLSFGEDENGNNIHTFHIMTYIEKELILYTKHKNEILFHSIALHYAALDERHTTESIFVEKGSAFISKQIILSLCENISVIEKIADNENKLDYIASVIIPSDDDYTEFQFDIARWIDYVVMELEKALLMSTSEIHYKTTILLKAIEDDAFRNKLLIYGYS